MGLVFMVLCLDLDVLPGVVQSDYMKHVPVWKLI